MKCEITSRPTTTKSPAPYSACSINTGPLKTTVPTIASATTEVASTVLAGAARAQDGQEPPD